MTFPKYVSSASNDLDLINKTTTNQTVVTGTVNNTITYSFLIPANTIRVGDILYFDFRNVFTGTANQKTNRCYINDTNDLTTPDQIFHTLSANTTLSIDASRRIAVKSSTVTQVYGISNSNVSSDFTSAVAVTEVNIDWTTDKYFIVAIQLANAADSGVLSQFRLIRC